VSDVPFINHHCYRIDCSSRTWRINAAYNRACH